MRVKREGRRTRGRCFARRRRALRRLDGLAPWTVGNALGAGALGDTRREAKARGSAGVQALDLVEDTALAVAGCADSVRRRWTGLGGYRRCGRRVLCLRRAAYGTPLWGPREAQVRAPGAGGARRRRHRRQHDAAVRSAQPAFGLFAPSTRSPAASSGRRRFHRLQVFPVVPLRCPSSPAGCGGAVRGGMTNEGRVAAEPLSEAAQRVQWQPCAPAQDADRPLGSLVLVVTILGTRCAAEDLLMRAGLDVATFGDVVAPLPTRRDTPVVVGEVRACAAHARRRPPRRRQWEAGRVCGPPQRPRAVPGGREAALVGRAEGKPGMRADGTQAVNDATPNPPAKKV